MTAKEIQREILRDGWRNISFPNYTPPGWWECDVFELTKAGYFREYEIKISRADFRADSKKSRSRWNSDLRSSIGVTKHSQLARRDINGPSRFFFVAPAGVIPTEELPPWAGLITAGIGQRGNIYLSPTVKAPKLHSEPYSKSGKDDIMRTAYFRFQWQYFQLAKEATQHDWVDAIEYHL